jgi:phosphatidate cytidylyltransferase
MDKELTNRIFTSLLLLPILIYCVQLSGYYLVVFLVFIYFLCFYEIIKNIKDLLFNIISNAILILALYSFYSLRGDTNYSLLTIYWILAATFLSDVGGYIIGKTFKGKKLTRISPKKTYSGSVGSFIFSILSLPLISSVQKYFYDEDLLNFYQLKYLFLAFSISFVCQFGDLYISFWKRKIKIKNTSNILPGHGGVLDRIDGLIFVLIFCLIIKNIGLI